MTHTDLIATDHPALAGHFPGNPIVPGVVILQRVIDAAYSEGYRISGVAQAKFNAPLLPGQPFTITLETKGTRLQFSVLRDGEPLTQGSLDVGPAAA